jgi:hypothetical protein
MCIVLRNLQYNFAPSKFKINIMKKLIFLFLFGITCGMNSTAQAQTPNTYTPSTAEIIIKETTTVTPVLKSMSITPIQAWLTGGQVEVLIQANLGSVTITITGTQGVVYQTSFVAAEDAELAIDAQGWTAGDYTIVIVRSNGRTYEGEFKL